MTELFRPQGSFAGSTCTDAASVRRSYVRFAALGDSVTHGIGNLWHDGWRGWAQILADAVLQAHDVSVCTLARPGATTTDIRPEQWPAGAPLALALG